MSLTPAQEMLNVKFNCDGFMTESESEEEEGVPELSKNTGPGCFYPSLLPIVARTSES